MTDKDKGSILVSCRYVLKTSKVGIILLSLAELLIALTAIYNNIFFINIFILQLILNNFV
jgi:hypothetical protein